MAYRRTRTRTRRSMPRRKVTRRVTTRRAQNGGNPWSREEIAFMRNYYRNHDTAWCARQLGRTVYSVRYKASDLNIKKANPSVWRENTPSRFEKASRRSSTTWKKRWATPKRRTNRRAISRRRTRRVTRRRSR